jgi:hypothetical protein
MQKSETAKMSVSGFIIIHETAAELRREFSVSPGLLTVILVGKDGGVKFRRNEQVDLE